jgi:hypothetical protein
MKLLVDDHNFTIPVRGTVGPNCCRLQIYVDDAAEDARGEVRALVVATQEEELATGVSLTNGAERYAEEAWKRYLPEHVQPPRWIEHYTSERRPHWMEVHFEVGPEYALRGPRWTGTSPAQVEEVIGRPVDASRGDRYVAPPPEPPRPTALQVMRVMDLPRPHPFRAPDCMPPAGPSPLGRWSRRLHPIRHRSCCWYHAGDWREVDRTVKSVLGASRHLVLHDAELDDLRNRFAMATPAGTWLHTAIYSLLGDPLVVGESSWVNGQHRGQAAIDSGARHILVVR